MLYVKLKPELCDTIMETSRRAGSDPRRGSKFSFENFNLWARRGGDVHFIIVRLYITVLD